MRYRVTQKLILFTSLTERNIKEIFFINWLRDTMLFIYLFINYNTITNYILIINELHTYRHTYIIGHYNLMVRIIDLVSHITYVVCDNFTHKWRNLQFN